MILILAAAQALLQSHPFLVKADEAKHAKGEIHFAGHVLVESQDFTAQAEKAHCAEAEKTPLTLEGKVHLTFTKEGQLHCDRALFNPDASCCQFTSSGPEGRIHFEDADHKLMVESRAGTLLLDQGKKVFAIEAIDRVHAETSHFSIDADQALFDAKGQIAIFRQVESPCIIHFGEDAHAFCTEATFYVQERRAVLVMPTGEVRVKEKLPMQFSAERMEFDDASAQLRLTSNVLIVTQLEQGPAQISSVESCFVDIRKSRVFLTPPTDGRLLLTAAFGHVRALNAELLFEPGDHEFLLTNMTLAGNVEICNTCSFKDPELTVNRYAIADRVELDCLGKEVALSAERGKRVLYLDEDKKVQVSAEAISVSYADGQEEIAGKGAVRMLFNEGELKMLTDRFPKMNRDSGS